MSVDQPRPTRRMTDMGPRRMDGFARPGAAGARPAPAGRPTSQPQMVRSAASRPAAEVQQQSRPMKPAGADRAMAAARMRAERPASAQPAPQARPAGKRGGGWKVVLQFVIGLAVIAGVAAAIVWLYIKYYQQ